MEYSGYADIFKKYLFSVVEEKRIKVILDSDVRNEADDQFAILHALLTPKFDVRGIIAAHFGHDRIERSMEASYAELEEVLRVGGFLDKVKMLHGAPKALPKPQGFFGKREIRESEGASFIIEEARKLALGEKLYLGVMGPLTNVAAALLLAPEITEKLVVVWNGGNVYPHGGMEFNLVNDIAAANVVFSSRAEVWQIPTKAYAKPRVGLAELQQKVYPQGEVGRFLFYRVTDFMETMRKSASWPRAESLDICDLTVNAVMLEEHNYNYEYVSAPFIDDDMIYHKVPNNRPIRVYHDVDGRYVLEDFFAKLAIVYGGK